MGVGLAGRPPCLPHSQALMGAGLAGTYPCLSHSQALMGVFFSLETSRIKTEYVLGNIKKMYENLPYRPLIKLLMCFIIFYIESSLINDLIRVMQNVIYDIQVFRISLAFVDKN